jgi:hypothetical protein
MIRSLVLVLCALSPLAGCASTDATAQPQPRAESAPASTPLASCTEVMTRARTCSDAFVPALVDARARADKPAGIAAQVAAHRDDVIAQARTEWAHDSTDAGIAASCDRIAAKADAADQQSAHECLAAADCTAFTACVIPVIAKHF